MDAAGYENSGGFEVWYQPQINMLNGRICGAEALVRWKNRNGKLIFPSEFIPFFERNGQITELDRFVLGKVCQDIRDAKKQSRKFGPVSVNLSKQNAQCRNIEKNIREITEKYEIGTTDLIFEITEGAELSSEGNHTKYLVHSLHEMGFQIDMDDYGTGSSSLKSLADIKFDGLKLDRSFIAGIGRKKMNIILESTIRMAEKLHIGIIAEGVETEEQMTFLIENGCYVAQGYYYYKPLLREDYLYLCNCGTGKEN